MDAIPWKGEILDFFVMSVKFTHSVNLLIHLKLQKIELKDIFLK